MNDNEYMINQTAKAIILILVDRNNLKQDLCANRIERKHSASASRQRWPRIQHRTTEISMTAFFWPKTSSTSRSKIAYLLTAFLILFLHDSRAQVGAAIGVRHVQPHTYTINNAGTLYVNFRFKASAPTAVAQKLFLHLLDGAGNIVFQDDHFPMTPAPQTTQWSGEVTWERVVNVPSTLAYGHYRIAIGLYDPLSGARTQLTTVFDSTSKEPTYTYEDQNSSKRYIVGEVNITIKDRSREAAI